MDVWFDNQNFMIDLFFFGGGGCKAYRPVCHMWPQTKHGLFWIYLATHLYYIAQ